MDIKIPGDGFCGTHALFLRMLMILYTREKTLSKLQENQQALMALQANHAIEPYTKPDIIAALNPLIAPFPNLKELIEDAQRNVGTQATDIVARAIQYTDKSIAQLTSLQENPDFRNLTRKLHAALGPDSTQRDLYTAIHTIILNFTNPSGAQPPHYLPMLRAFMETVVESHLFSKTIEACKEKTYATLRPKMPKLLSDSKLHEVGTAQKDEELDVYCREVAQALIQRQPHHEQPAVDALLRSKLVQPILERAWEENFLDTPPNIGNLLALFAKTNYTRTSCGPSFYTEHTDLILVNDLFPLEDVVNDIHGIQLQHVNGNHWDIQIPDKGFLLDTLRSEPTEASYESPGAEATAASTTPPTQPSHTPPCDDDHSPDPDDVALENRLLQQTITKAQTILPPPNFTKANVSAGIPLIANKGVNPATEAQKNTLLENYRRISEKIDHLQKKVTKNDQHEDKLVELAQIKSSVTVVFEELTKVGIKNLTENDYNRLNRALILANKDQGNLAASLSPTKRKPAK